MSTRRERRLVDRFEHARLLHEAGRLREAEAEYRAVLSARVKRDEPSHPETLAAWQQLALLISVDGRADEAADIAATTTEAYAREYGLHHPETLQSRVSLALVRFTQGRFTDAVASELAALRGVQVTDSNGKVTFTSIFPACYSGRWPHVHFEIYPSLDKATTSSNAIHTSQLALPEDVCNTVYATDGYSASVKNLAGVTLANDNIFSDGYGTQLATVTGDVTNGYVAKLMVGVNV